MTENKKVFTLTEKKKSETIQVPTVVEPPQKLKRSGSVTGLHSLTKGVDDLQNLLSEQRKALDECREQITLQNELILGYQQVLEEHEQLFNSIIDG